MDAREAGRIVRNHLRKIGLKHEKVTAKTGYYFICVTVYEPELESREQYDELIELSKQHGFYVEIEGGTFKGKRIVATLSGPRSRDMAFITDADN